MASRFYISCLIFNVSPDYLRQTSPYNLPHFYRCIAFGEIILMEVLVMNAQILINNGINWYEFSESRTGQLDYLGKADISGIDEVSGYEEITSSTYFSPCNYKFLCDELNNVSKVFVAPNVNISDCDIFSYLVHIGALLNAVEAKDSLLAGELYLRRKDIFERFSPLTQYILKDFSVEILFSLCFGIMGNVNENSVPLILNSALKTLKSDLLNETLEQAYIRYFNENDVTVTLPIVGMGFYKWRKSARILDRLSYKLLDCKALEGDEKIRKAKHIFLRTLRLQYRLNRTTKRIRMRFRFV